MLTIGHHNVPKPTFRLWHALTPCKNSIANLVAARERCIEADQQRLRLIHSTQPLSARKGVRGVNESLLENHRASARKRLWNVQEQDNFCRLNGIFSDGSSQVKIAQGGSVSLRLASGIHLRLLQLRLHMCNRTQLA